MSKISLKIVLGLLGGLMAIKRVLLSFFAFLSRYFLEEVGRILARFFVFPIYKLFLKFFLKSGRLWSGILNRQALFLSLLLVSLFLVAGESKTYGASKYLTGRESLLFQYLGPGEEGDFFEEETTTAPLTKIAAPNLQEGVSATLSINEIPSFSLESFGYSQIVNGVTAPIILPGVEIGGRREIIRYVVQPGDTLAGIAQKNKISAETLLLENKLTARSVLRPGDVLIILPVSGISHKVKKGDTWAKIASLYRVDAQRIIEFNNLSEETLPVGEVIVIPEGKTPPSPTVVKKVVSQPAQTSAARPSALRTFNMGMIWPTSGRSISQYFTWRHTGIDIALPTGNQIYAVDNGVVEKSGWNRGGYGYMILLDHGNGLKTRYAHASKLFVQPGDEVQKGEVIALIGSTGRSTGPHLHFEVIAGGVRVNPFLYVR